MKIKDPAKVHEDNIARLSKLLPSVDVEVIREKYNGVRKKIEADTKIDQFVPILVYRATLVQLVKK